MKKQFFPVNKKQKLSLLKSIQKTEVLKDNLESIVGGAWDDKVHWPESTWRDVIRPIFP